jgi:hypothetical protein
MNRQELCREYTRQHPDEEWDENIHHILSDYNVEDHWLYGGIATIAHLLSDYGDENEKLLRQFRLLVVLLSAPMPDGWDE